MAKKQLSLRGPVVGIILKELVRRAIVIARRQMATFEIGTKAGYDDCSMDVFTTADRQAQDMYVKLLQECFPEVGIVGEEDALTIASAEGVSAYFTIDPIDGTKAYIRHQSHGIGSMVALVVDGIIEAAYVGDVNSLEIFGYRPDASSAWRITNLEVFQQLDADPPEVDMKKTYLLLRARESKYSAVARRTIDECCSVLIDGGSIGTWAARLWKREVGGLILQPSWETPWDSTPVLGISKKLGYTFLKPLKSMDGWEEYIPPLSSQKFRRNHDLFIMHKNHLEQLGKLMKVVRL